MNKRFAEELAVSCACLMLFAGCGGGGSTPAPPAPPAIIDYAIGGQAAGLTPGQSLTLRNVAETLVVSGNGSFSFGSRVGSGAGYSVTVEAEPVDRQCNVAGGSGTVASTDVTTVNVTCTIAANWVTDGNVLATALSPDGRVLYVAGDFAHVGPRTGSFVPLSAATGARQSFPAVVGDANARLPDGAGGWYLGGSISAVGKVKQRYLVHVLADGSVDSAFRPNPDGAVNALARIGNRLFVGGEFSTIGGASNRYYLAELDAGTGAARGLSVTPGGAVRLLEVSGNTLYVAGGFLQVAGVARNYLAAVDLTTNTVTNWDPQLSGGSGIVALRALKAAGRNIFLAGEFRTVGGQDRASVAAVDAITGTPTAFSARVGGGSVYAMTVDDNVVYLGGSFDTAGGQTRKAVAALDAVSGNALAWNPSIAIDGVSPPAVTSLATTADTVFIAGVFWSIDTQAALNIGAVDKTSGLPRSWYGGAPQSFLSLDTVGDKVWVGGQFATIGGVERNHIAAIDVKTGEPTDWNPQASQGFGPFAGQVTTLLALGSRVYAAGTFERIGGESRNGLAALDSLTGLALGWAPNVVGQIRSLAASGDTVYLGGFGLVSVNGQARKNLAAVHATSGAVLPWSPDLESAQVNKILAAGSLVYAVGTLQMANGPPRNNAAAFDAVSGVLSAWNPNVSGTVTDMALQGDVIYLAGGFNSAGGKSQIGVARVDASSGAGPADSRIGIIGARAIAVSGDTVYVATNRGGGLSPAAAIVGLKADLTGQTSVPYNPSLEGHVNSLSLSAGTVYAGGAFTDIQGEAGQGLAFLSR